MCLALTLLYYIISAIQYWISDYMITVLKQEEAVVFVCFAFISITGPILGIVVGGNVGTKLGGFNTRRSMRMTCALAPLAIFSAVPIPFVDSFAVVAALVWFLLFAGGFILPSCISVMLNQVAKDQKTAANSVGNFFFNILGYLPAPFLYGFIYDMGEGGNARVAMGFIMFTPILAIAFLWASMFFILRDFKDPEEEE